MNGPELSPTGAIIGAFIMGAAIMYFIYTIRKKRWYIETMAPRNEYELGKEKKLIINMNLAEKTFNGFRAGAYTVLLTHGTLGEFSKPILSGKIEEQYSMVITKSLMEKEFLRVSERRRFTEWLWKRLPQLSVKNYLITGELVSPVTILDMWETEHKMGVWFEMKKRGLVDPKVLWVRPYPPEGRLKEIMSGLYTIPNLIEEHEKDVEGITITYRETLIKMNRGLASFLTKFIPLARYVITSISDPMVVIGMIIADRAEQIKGLGLRQLAEKGGIKGVIEAAKMLMRHKKDLMAALGGELKPEELKKISALQKELTVVMGKLKELEKLPETVATLEKKIGAKAT